MGYYPQDNKVHEEISGIWTFSWNFPDVSRSYRQLSKIIICTSALIDLDALELSN
jgi:hypothetical protein